MGHGYCLDLMLGSHTAVAHVPGTLPTLFSMVAQADQPVTVNATLMLACIITKKIRKLQFLLQ